MTTTRRSLIAVAVLLVIAALVAAAVVLWPEESEPAPVGGDERTTPRSLAYVANEHVDLEPTKAGVDWAADGYRRLFPHPKRAVAASINFAGEGNIVVIGVSPERPQQDPRRGCMLSDSCADLSDGILLTWDLESPEEDPGLVVLYAEKEDATVAIRYSGPIITGDPRDLDLPVPVDVLVDIALDPRIAPTTSQDAIDGGEKLGFWLDGNSVI